MGKDVRASNEQIDFGANDLFALMGMKKYFEAIHLSLFLNLVTLITTCELSK